MGFKSESYTPAQSQCILSLFAILAPNMDAFYWGTGKVNWIDRAENPEYGVYVGVRDREDNFFPAYKLLNRFFFQQIILFSRVTFIEHTPRPPADIKIPADWNFRTLEDLMIVSRKSQYQFYVDLLTWLFADDVEMSDKVNALVVPVDSTADGNE